ncbi:HlyB/MsbA family ABC transporter [Lachnospiraceae bacterium TWA4]|nr:HlyB/MsbA family ABC transporter [Lachnospiraceae bacterium TWA4]
MQHKKVRRMTSVIYLLKKIKHHYWKIGANIIGGILRFGSMTTAYILAAMLAVYAWEGTFNEHTNLIPYLSVAIILSGVMYYVDMWFSHDVAYRIIVEFRLALYHSFETICPEVLLKNRSGQLAVTLMNDVEMTEYFFGHTFGAAISSTIVSICTLIFFATIHPAISLWMLFGLVLLVFVPVIFYKEADRQGEENRYVLGEANSVTLEGVNGMKEVLTLNAKESYKKKNEKFMKKLTDNQVAYFSRQALEGTMIQGCVGILALGATAIALYLSSKGLITSMELVITAVVSWMAYTCFVDVCSLARSFGLVFAACERIFNVLNSDPLVEDCGKDIDINKLKPEIEFKDVCFSYGEEFEDALTDINFKIKAGETVALVGASGAGKTTCMNLLLRLWDVKSGKITIGGKDIREMSLDNIHTLTSAVLQDVYLFNTSIRENIRLGNEEASDKDVEEAARLALADGFIKTMTEGYDTITGERGVTLSGGQRQRVSIARALLKKSPVLVFDEAVSSLDTMSEKEIQKTLKVVSKGKTVLMVAHRLSTIQMADRIIVLKNGRVEEIGTQDELLSRDSYYKELLASQLSA